jgi:hypothetical protein
MPTMATTPPKMEKSFLRFALAAAVAASLR